MMTSEFDTRFGIQLHVERVLLMLIKTYTVLLIS